MEELIAVKVHETAKGAVVGACDIELLGKSLSEGELKLHISEEFYFSKRARPEDLVKLLEGCLTANLVGERVVKAYCKANPEAEECIIVVEGVPHLQVYRL
mgnify:CR=1 FL=1